VERRIGQFRKLLASIIAVKGGHLEHLNTVFNMTTRHRNDRGYSLPKLSDCSIYVKHYAQLHMCHPVLPIRDCLSRQQLRHVATVCDAEQFDGSRVAFSVVFVFVVARKRQQMSLRMPRDCECWAFTRYVRNLLPFKPRHTPRVKLTRE